MIIRHVHCQYFHTIIIEALQCTALHCKDFRGYLELSAYQLWGVCTYVPLLQKGLLVLGYEGCFFESSDVMCRVERS